MPLPRLVPNAAQARLDALTTVDLAVFDATLVPSVLATDVDALAGEIDGGIATGYARITGVAVAWNPTTQRLELDDPDPVFDLDDAVDVTYLVAYDPVDDQVVSFLPFAGGPMPGYDGFVVELPDGIAGRGNEWPLQTAIEDHGTRITALENAPAGLPDPSGEDDGDVLTVSSGAAVWAPPTGGGGSSWSRVSATHLGLYTDGDAVIIVRVGPSIDGPTDTPTLVDTIPVGLRPEDPLTFRASWLGAPPAYGDCLVVIDDDAGTQTSTPGGVMVMDLSGTLGPSDDVLPLLAGLTWVVGS